MDTSAFVMQQLARWQRLPSRYRAARSAINTLARDPQHRVSLDVLRTNVDRLEREWLDAQEITARVVEALAAASAGREVPVSVLPDIARLAALMLAQFDAMDRVEAQIRALGGSLTGGGVPGWVWAAVVAGVLALRRARTIRW